MTEVENRRVEIKTYAHDGYFIEVYIDKHAYRAWLWKAGVGYKMAIASIMQFECTIEAFLAYILERRWDECVEEYKEMFEDEQE